MDTTTITINDEHQNPIEYEVLFSAESVEIDDNFGTQDHGLEIEISQITNIETGKTMYYPFDANFERIISDKIGEYIEDCQNDVY